jgi:hypothetical protein
MRQASRMTHNNLFMLNPHEEFIHEAKDIFLGAFSGKLVSRNSGRLVVTTERLLWNSDFYALRSRELLIMRHEIMSARLIEPPRFDFWKLFGHSTRRLEITLKDRTRYRFEGAQTEQIYVDLDQ